MDASIDGVRLAGTPQGPVPVVVLGVEGERDVVPIFVGMEEATSIARGLEATDVGRPLTHDLLLDVMEELGGRVERVVVSDLAERGEDAGTYIADLHVTTPRETVVVDARPSDSLALAARTTVPIEIAESVFERSAEEPETYADLTDIREMGGEPA
ncbi:bifunctional nuclease family protein [Halovivax cerinus]|uniref:Bifunctional nuclease family protein n=1 Tax=Halovivax cerinus TaxID=1487865 RepID=A0ABD5NNX3_9EURY|nr:bifunctional nuclease family protein [Halovivax cerinus]